MSGSCQSSLLDTPPQSSREGGGGPFPGFITPPPLPAPVGGLGKQNRALGTGACPEATSFPPRPPRRLLSICPDASARHVACGSGWTFISAPRGAHGTRIQTGVPAQGAHKLNETQQTHTHRTRTQGVGHLPGRQTVEEPRAGAQRGQASPFGVSPWGAGRAEVAQDGVPSPGGTQERAPGGSGQARGGKGPSVWMTSVGSRESGGGPGWRPEPRRDSGESPRGSGPARGGKGPSVWMTRGLTTWRQENEAGSPGGGPEPMAGGCPLGWRAVPAVGWFPGPSPRTELQGRGPLSYLPDPPAPSDLRGRDQKKRNLRLLTGVYTGCQTRWVGRGCAASRGDLSVQDAAAGQGPGSRGRDGPPPSGGGHMTTEGPHSLVPVTGVAPSS
ncbi:hypothetical protein D623_10005293 [Myotis brandtii]|uniref:Uncharacterized protein n=1 Tax=Myotis brandtii TaxID=109478 RepID=S7N347_MYOBR|nr:hypothetical protein D623_10005293 [Myotis brandtii]